MFSLPKSTSGFLSLDGIDLLKVLRLAGVTFIGAFAASVAAAGDLATADLATVFQGALQAGLMAVSASAVETFRRLLTSNQ